MAKRKERALNELYNVTQIVQEPEITPVLRGSFRMQGPVDEIDDHLLTNTVTFQVGKGFSGHSTRKELHVIIESGTCNVCSVPCSSCLHIKQTLMGSKSDEAVDEMLRENACSYSVAENEPIKSRKCGVGQHTPSETSNLVSVSSTHDSVSENAESKADTMSSDVSGASEDVEVLPKLSSARSDREDKYSLKPRCDSAQKVLVNRFEDPKGLEGHDDNLSCISRANESNNSSSHDIENADRINIPCSSTSTSGMFPEMCDKTCDLQTALRFGEIKCETEGSHNNSRQSRCSEESMHKVSPPKSLSTELSSHNSGLVEMHSVRDLDDGAGLQIGDSINCNNSNGEPPSCGSNLKNTDKKLDGYFDRVQFDCSRDDLNSPMNKEKFEENIAEDACDQPADASNSEQQCEIQKLRESLLLPDIKEASLNSQHVDDSDESDIVLHDVNICDICGDAGREDLLASCCRCGDGAEHTYCMREMLDKVPEGDWLCEECKLEDETKNQEHDIIDDVYRNDRNQSSVKSDAKGSDAEVDRTNKDQSNSKLPVRRPADEVEVPSVAKRQALEPIVGSPKLSSPSRMSSLSRDNSFRNLERGKLKPAYQFSSRINAANDTPDMTPSANTFQRLQSPRGTFLKSNSFNTLNTKPKVKLVDEVVPLKHKLGREPPFLEAKDGPSRLMGKSMSFKFTNSRSNMSESKVRMLSPKFSHVQDPKNFKQAKERGLHERRSSFKSEQPLVSTTMGVSTVSTPKGDKKLSPSKVSNNRELKAVQSDSRSIPSSKLISHIARRGSEFPIPLGEAKKNSSGLPSIVGVSSVNGTNNSAEQRSIQGNLKDCYSSKSCIAERTQHNVGEIPANGLPHPRDFTNSGERIEESDGSHSRHSNAASAKCIACQKCKEVGHSAQVCTVDSPQSFDASSARSLREDTHKDNKLKAAIEAAMLKKPGICRKNKVTEQSEELPVSSMNCEIASQDQLSCTSNMRNAINAGGAHFTMVPFETVTCKTGDACLFVPFDGKPSTRDFPVQASAALSALLKTSAIPDHQYIWQGNFEICRNGKNSDVCNGIQAHLSTCASPKVIEAVNKFPRKVLLNEVARLSTWPIQFLESGVREDNIALYFFAKDLESYENSYKILMETMMRNDLALKGNVDGVELLIFPSNQLPEKCQRWNMLFFLWGVFRGKRADSLQHVPNSVKKSCIPMDIPVPIMSFPENICSLGPIDKDLPAHDRICDVGMATEAAGIELSSSSSPEIIKGNCDTKEFSPVSKSENLQVDVEQPSCRITSRQTSCGQLCPISASSSPSLEKHVDIDCKVDVKLHSSLQASNPVNAVSGNERKPMEWNNILDGQHVSSHSLGKSAANSLGSGTIEGEETSRNDITLRMVKDTKHLCVDSLLAVPQSATSEINRIMPWNKTNHMLVDGECASNKQKFGFPEYYETDNFASSWEDGFASQPQGGCPCLATKKICDEACDSTFFPQSSGNAEKFFFPVDPRPREDIGVNDISMPWKVFSSSDEGGLDDKVPNLELALGAETKSSKRGVPPFLFGKVDKKINQDQTTHKAATSEGDEDSAASLSLSLSFPFPDKEQAAKPASKSEQLLPERRHFNTSLLLFGGFSDK